MIIITIRVSQQGAIKTKVANRKTCLRWRKKHNLPLLWILMLLPELNEFRAPRRILHLQILGLTQGFLF